MVINKLSPVCNDCAYADIETDHKYCYNTGEHMGGINTTIYCTHEEVCKFLEKERTEDKACMENKTISHSVKTRKTEFMKLFPDCVCDECGYPLPNVCVGDFVGSMAVCDIENDNAHCDACTARFWDKEIE